MNKKHTRFFLFVFPVALLITAPATAHWIGSGWRVDGCFVTMDGYEGQCSGAVDTATLYDPQNRTWVWVTFNWSISPNHPVWSLCYKEEKQAGNPCDHERQLANRFRSPSVHVPALFGNTVYEYRLEGWSSKKEKWLKHADGCFAVQVADDGTVSSSPAMDSCRKLRKRFSP